MSPIPGHVTISRVVIDSLNALQSIVTSTYYYVTVCTLLHVCSTRVQQMYAIEWNEALREVIKNGVGAVAAHFEQTFFGAKFALNRKRRD